MFRRIFERFLNARAVALLREIDERVSATEDHLESLQRRFDKWSAKQRMRAIREDVRPDDAEAASVAAQGGGSPAPVDGGQDRSALRAALRDRARLNGFLPRN